MPAKGFTILELMLALGTVAVLSLLAAGSYRIYVVRAQAAQALINVDQITTVVRVENRLDNPDLHLDAAPGAAPPKLKGTLPDVAFQGRDGITLAMIKAPAGMFASYHDRATYALVVAAPEQAALQLAALRWGLSREEGDAPWLDTRSFVFPIEPIAIQADAVTSPPEIPPCTPKGGKGKDWCWCRDVSGSKVKEPC